MVFTMFRKEAPSDASLGSVARCAPRCYSGFQKRPEKRVQVSLCHLKNVFYII